MDLLTPIGKVLIRIFISTLRGTIEALPIEETKLSSGWIKKQVCMFVHGPMCCGTLERDRTK